MKRWAAAAVLAAASVAIAGCGQGGTKSESVAFPTYSRIPTTDATFDPTIAPLPVTETETVPRTPTVAAPRGPWVVPPEATEGTVPAERSYGPPSPGITVTDGKNDCTLGFATTSSRGEPSFLTAGHCVNDQSTTLKTTDTSGRDYFLTPYSAKEYTDYMDLALTFLPPGDPGSYPTSISSRIRVVRALSVAEVSALPADTPICVSGARAFIRCGGKTSSDRTQIHWGGEAFHGDSGCPVFVVNPQGEAYAVGLLSRGDGSIDEVRGNQATLAEPALKMWGLELRG